jgi:hypothetical protein
MRILRKVLLPLGTEPNKINMICSEVSPVSPHPTAFYRILQERNAVAVVIHDLPYKLFPQVDLGDHVLLR